jgi:hypothetical protein
MAWFAAHVVLYLEVEPASPGPISVFENVYLVEVESEGAARVKAEMRGRADCGNDGGTLTHEGRAAELRYGGIRKLISPRRSVESLAPSPEGPNDSVEDGAEVTYSRLVVSSRDDLDALVSGKPVSVSYEE